MWVRQALVACALALALSSCKRDADKPLPSRTLFPDVVQNIRKDNSTRMQRAEVLQAVEPDDQRSEALGLPLNVVVQGRLESQASNEPSSASGGKRAHHTLGKRSSKWQTIDTDWFVVKGPAQPNSLARIELRDAPKCAQLTLYNAQGKALRRATWTRGVRPVLPNQRMDSLPLYVRVHCVVRKKRSKKKSDRIAVGGAYKLALSTRAGSMDEEREPNDTIGPNTSLLTHGQTLQGTLAPRADVDLVRLNLTGAIGGQAQMLSVAGSPGVRLQLRLLHSAKGIPLIVRKPRRGDGVVIPNLDIRRLSDPVTLELKTLSGQAPDAPYAVTIQTFVPGGCASQSACPDRVPIEREPNDQRQVALGIAANALITGVIDGSADKDWYEVDGVVGQVMSVELQAPSGIALELQAGHDKTPWVTLRGGAQGQFVRLPGRRISKRRVYIRVSGVEGDADVTALYHLRVSFRDDVSFRQPAQALQPLLAAPEGQGYLRSGALLSPRATHTYTLDLSANSQPQSGLLRLTNDGAARQRCTLRSSDGKLIATTLSGIAGDSPNTPVLLPPALYQLSVENVSETGAASAYQVSVRELTDSVPPPGSLTPTQLPERGRQPALGNVPSEEETW
ncbi:MAG TPA: hypothetical protein DCQ06_11115 [Myxococcales bacterium]|nr:hypothetical protein [Myxococcales bacterium]HAN32138.1 hypothetical protein [Myxococcales bacterium]